MPVASATGGGSCCSSVLLGRGSASSSARTRHALAVKGPTLLRLVSWNTISSLTCDAYWLSTISGVSVATADFWRTSWMSS
jgi:hypothetical protein